MGGLADLMKNVNNFASTGSGSGSGKYSMYSIAEVASDFVWMLNTEIQKAPIPAGVKNALINQASLDVSTVSNTAVVGLMVQRPSYYIAKYGSKSHYGAADIGLIYNYGAVIKKGKLARIPGFNKHPAGHFVESAIDKFNAKYGGDFHADLV